MKKIIAVALVALSVASGVAATAHADYFGTSKQTQEGQLLPGTFGDVEKNGI